MAQTPEAKVKAAVRKLLTELGVYYFAPASNGMGDPVSPTSSAVCRASSSLSSARLARARQPPFRSESYQRSEKRTA